MEEAPTSTRKGRPKIRVQISLKTPELWILHQFDPRKNTKPADIEELKISAAYGVRNVVRKIIAEHRRENREK